MPPYDVSSFQETYLPWIFPSVFLQEAIQLSDSNYHFCLNSQEKERVKSSYRSFRKHLETGIKIYGTHTHFGAQVDNPNKASHTQHQCELIRFLQVGTGALFKESVVRRALRLQVKKMVQGLSGISLETLEAVVNLSNSPTLPPVPREGSLGASGDLIPMAHAIGDLFERVDPSARDALALVNTNSMMVSHALDVFIQVQQLVKRALEATVKIMVATQMSTECLSLFKIEQIKEQRPVSAQVADWMQKRVRELGHNTVCHSLQSRYSLRCSPIVYGLVCDLLEQAESKIRLEYEALADNPILTSQELYHGGLFYTAYLASASDQVMEVIARTSEMLDRQVLLLMDPALNGGLSVNLEYPGKSHAKGLHQMISSLYQRIRSFGVPAWQMSFSTESNNQDIVPASMQAWNRLADALDIFEHLVRASEFCAKRALDLRKGNVPQDLQAWKAF